MLFWNLLQRSQRRGAWRDIWFNKLTISLLRLCPSWTHLLCKPRIQNVPKPKVRTIIQIASDFVVFFANKRFKILLRNYPQELCKKWTKKWTKLLPKMHVKTSLICCYPKFCVGNLGQNRRKVQQKNGKFCRRKIVKN